MGKTLLLLVSSLFFADVLAQTRPPAPAAPLVAARVVSMGHRDTVAAVNQLFERRRRGGRRWMLVAIAGGTAAVLSIRGTNSTTNTPAGPITTSTGLAGGAAALTLLAYTGIPAVVGVSKLSRFDERHQQAVIKFYNAGQPLPRYIGQRLRRKDLPPQQPVGPLAPR